MKKKRKIHKDKHGRDYIKESYFIGGKMKLRRIYVTDGIPSEEFYEQNATDLDHYLNGEYWLISSEKDRNFDESNKHDTDLLDGEKDDLPF